MKAAVHGISLAALTLLGACAVGPDYQKPAVEMPAAWKVEAPWREAAPKDAADKGPWWERFGDPQLNKLEEQALAQSPTLVIAGARFAQARATLAAVSSQQLPQVGLTVRDSRARISAARPLTNNNSPQFTTTQSDYIVNLAVGYEVDLAGRVQRSVEGARASAEQSAIDFENVRLLLTADVATAYFNLRSVDIEIDVLRRSIELQKKSLAYVSTRHELGATSGLDVAQQKTLIDNTLVQLDVLHRQRSQFLHALATLTGTPAPLFELAADPKVMTPPAIPAGVPSDVLERRPDVASAERAMAAANAQIGVATSAFYPSIVLGASYGSDTRLLENLFNAPAVIWSVGVTAAQNLFDGGRIRAGVDFASAGYEATVANYRRVVLTAMQEVEDGIVGLAALERAHTQAKVATASATRVLDLASARYEGGVATSLDVIVAQQALLNSERLAAQLAGQRLLTSVFLIKALGGDWPGTGKVATQP